MMVSQSEVSQRFTSQHQGPALPNCLKIPLLETSGFEVSPSKTGKKTEKKKEKEKKEKEK